MKEIPKTPLPKDPRGPLPNFKSAEEAQQWFKTHPDPELTQPKTLAPAKYGLTGSDKLLPTIGHGDLIFGHGSSSSGSFSYGYFRHTGMYNVYNGGFVTANVDQTLSGVCVEQLRKWSTQYEDVSINIVSNVAYSQKQNIVQNAMYHLGEPYNVTSSKSNTTEWYCSKLSWFEYNKWGGVDLDRDGGYFVTPDDEYYSDYVHQYWRG